MRTTATESKPRSRRFLWLIRGDEGYGIRRANLGMVEVLKKSSIEVGFVAIGSGSFASEIASAGYPLWIMDQFKDSEDKRKTGWKYIIASFKLMFSSITNVKNLCKVIRSFRPDWLHISINSLLVVGGASSRVMGIPSYWHIHNTIKSKLPLGLQPLGYQLICRLLSIHAMANSRHTAQSLGSDCCTVSILYPGTNATYFSQRADFNSITRESLGLDAENPIFVIAARLVPDKAQDIVVEAAIKLLDSGYKFSLLLVGGPLDTPYSSKLLELIESANVSQFIRFIGPVEDTRPYIRISDVVINSRRAAEPFGLSIVESLLMERPVLAYELGGPLETVSDEYTGWLIKTPSVNGYRDGIVRALEARKHWLEMGIRGRVLSLSKYSIEATAQSYLEIVGADEMVVSKKNSLAQTAVPAAALI